MKDEALDLLCKRGLSVIPVGRNKRPLISWEEFQHRLPTEDEVEAWFDQWPEANVAIVTGEVSGIVVADADGPEGLAWMQKNLPETTTYVQTGKGWHAYFRHPGVSVSNKVRIAPEVDIRGDGGYVVAPPSIHESGRVYTWTERGEWEYMPPFPVQLIQGSVRPATGMSFDLSGVSAAVSLEPDAVKGERNMRLAQLVGSLAGQGLPPEVIALAAHGWNAKLSNPLRDFEVNTTIESILKTHERNHPGALEAANQNRSHDVELLDIQQEEDTCTIPDDCFKPGGLMGRFMDYMEASSPVSNPTYNLAGAIALMGTLAGQRVQTETGLRTNVYCIAVGVSGTGKDTPQSALPAIIMRSRAPQILGPNSISSDSAIVRHLSSQGRTVCFWDEIGLLLAAIKSPNSPRREIPSMLMQLFSGTDRPYCKGYTDEKNTINVKWHHFSFYGASTPDRFWQSLSSGETSDGFLARCLIFESNAEPMRPNTKVRRAIPKDLIEAVSEFDLMRVDTEPGNLNDVPVPLVIEKTQEASFRFDAWAEKYDDLRRKFCRSDDFRASIYGRAAEHAHKLALIHAVSLAGAMGINENTCVDIESVDWATRLIDALISNTIAKAADNIAETEFERLAQRVVRTIKAEVLAKRRSGKPGASRAQIESKLKTVDTVTVDKILKKLQYQGVIVERPWKGKAGPECCVFCLVKKDED